MNKKYKIIYADPPWPIKSGVYQDGGRKERKIEDQYPIMTIEQIKNLPIRELSAKDCSLFLWVTDLHLKECFEIIDSWGFKYKTIAFNWIKKYKTGTTCVNFSRWTLKSHEICLLATKGSPKKICPNIRCLVEAERTKHSKKPDEVRKRIIELMGDVPRIELFAREKSDGWDVWGNEVESDIDFAY